jgi:phosphotransacetylase
MVTTEHSHQAAAAAVALARDGQVDAVLKGSLHTDELMQPALAPGSGLATDRQMSHVFVMDVLGYPRLLYITDAALNAEPDLAAKRDIVQNAIDLARVLSGPTPTVAILSAIETVNPALRSSLDAAALAKMAERGQIRGGIVDGPLAFDDAVSPAAARPAARNRRATPTLHLANYQPRGHVAGDRAVVEPQGRPRLQFGLRFSRKARIPSCASGSRLVAAMTSTA